VAIMTRRQVATQSTLPPLGRPPRQPSHSTQRTEGNRLGDDSEQASYTNSNMSLPLTQAPSMMPQAWQDSLKSQLKEQEASKAWIREVIANRMSQAHM
jgi:hypothetical protein